MEHVSLSKQLTKMPGSFRTALSELKEMQSPMERLAQYIPLRDAIQPHNRSVRDHRNLDALCRANVEPT